MGLILTDEIKRYSRHGTENDYEEEEWEYFNEINTFSFSPNVTLLLVLAFSPPTSLQRNNVSRLFHNGLQ